MVKGIQSNEDVFQTPSDVNQQSNVSVCVYIYIYIYTHTHTLAEVLGIA